MGYRIVIDMALAPAAEARLWALVCQRGVEVMAASFKKNQQDQRIHATLEVDMDLSGARRLMRQLGRHHDIQRISLDPEHFADLSQGQPCNPLLPARRLRVSTKKGAWA